MDNKGCTDNLIIDDSNEKDAVTNPDLSLARTDLVCSILIFALGAFVLITGIYIACFAINGTDVWYYSPGMYPILIGSVLMILSILLFLKKRREGAKLRDIKISLFFTVIKTNTVFRLALAIVLLAIYVFILIGRIPFVVATFIYLAVTMITFRKNHFPIWKILIISVFTTALIYVFFGIIAAVPLP